MLDAVLFIAVILVIACQHPRQFLSSVHARIRRMTEVHTNGLFSPTGNERN